MTIEEFNKTQWGANMKFSYKGQVYDVCSVNFGEALIGYCTEFDDELSWVRCENIELQN